MFRNAKTRLPRILLLWIGLGLVVCLAFVAPRLWSLIFYRQVRATDAGQYFISGHRPKEFVGYHVESRWDDAWLRSEYWHTENGMLALRRQAGLSTQWDEDGKIIWQETDTGSGLQFRNEPPWAGNETDQSQPTAPWLRRGLTAEAWLQE